MTTSEAFVTDVDTTRLLSIDKERLIAEAAEATDETTARQMALLDVALALIVFKEDVVPPKDVKPGFIPHRDYRKYTPQAVLDAVDALSGEERRALAIISPIPAEKTWTIWLDVAQENGVTLEPGQTWRKILGDHLQAGDTP